MELVRSFAVTFSQRQLSPPRSESWHQLIYAIRGVVTVRSDRGAWVVPPGRAVWMPADVEYRLEMPGQTALRMIYLRRGAAQSSDCAVIDVSPLLRELILRVTKIGALYRNVSNHRRIAGLIQDELRAVQTVPLQVPVPQSEQAVRFVGLVERGLADGFQIDRALRDTGASRRTMERLFQAECGMSLGRWIRRRKLLFGLEELLQGETVSDVAFRLGYSTPSAFIAMFKREIGFPPGAYVAIGARPDRHLR